MTIRGLDVFDPTTGEARTSGTEDIAYWFIDSHYDGQSFFVRHEYFCWADEPYEKLKKALRAEIDEASGRSCMGQQASRSTCQCPARSRQRSSTTSETRC